jgi:hypothetical protein
MATSQQPSRAFQGLIGHRDEAVSGLMITLVSALLSLSSVASLAIEEPTHTQSSNAILQFLARARDYAKCEASTHFTTP